MERYLSENEIFRAITCYMALQGYQAKDAVIRARDGEIFARVEVEEENYTLENIHKFANK